MYPYSRATSSAGGKVMAGYGGFHYVVLVRVLARPGLDAQQACSVPPSHLCNATLPPYPMQPISSNNAGQAAPSLCAMCFGGLCFIPVLRTPYSYSYRVASPSRTDTRILIRRLMICVRLSFTTPPPVVFPFPRPRDLLLPTLSFPSGTCQAVLEPLRGHWC